MDSFDRLWLKTLSEELPPCDAPEAVAREELRMFFAGRNRGEACEFNLTDDPSETCTISHHGSRYVLTGGPRGALYGAYELIQALSLGRTPDAEWTVRPAYALRMLNAWDNMDGVIERGYAGQSLWFRNGRFAYEKDRILFLGRLLASVHINVLCVNNVNVHAPAQALLTDMLPDLAAFADLLRPFGVRLMASADFSMPLQLGCDTADPLDPDVQAFWARTAARVWTAIPDFAGFLIKADSEHRPGPNAYGRSHAEGANMLAAAVAPYQGVIVWRAFVYDCMQDWRDQSVDRPCAAYRLYQPQDGLFDERVILQVKHGPFDFQVREPLSPLLLSMRHTRLALELQLAQEYTGQQIDLYAMPPMWEELRRDLPQNNIAAVAAVSNLGDSYFWTGHPFAALNLYAYGRFASQPDSAARGVMSDWCRLTYPELSEDERAVLLDILMDSRRVYEAYTSPLGLGWMVTPHTHYGPNPDGYEFDVWGTYHRADRSAVGIDRTSAGTGYTCQYPETLRRLYERPETCPEELLLFFHRLPYDWRMKDGRTLIQRIYDDHFAGVEAVRRAKDALSGLHLPEKDRAEANRRMALQLKNACEWRDVINTFFYRFCGIDDEKGRKIYP